MQLNKKYEREISLRDMFFHILYHWRSILIAIVVLALALGGYAHLNNMRTKSKNAAKSTETTTVADPVRENYEASNRLYSQLMDEEREYLKRSILMKVNPKQVWKATAVYMVIPEEQDAGAVPAGYSVGAQIAAVYPTLLFDGVDAKVVKKIFGEDEMFYIREIVKGTAIPNSASFQVDVIGTDKQMAKDGLKYFDKLILEASQGEIQQAQKHRIAKITAETRQVVDIEAESRQATVAKEMTTYQNAVITNTKAIDTNGGSGGSSSGKKKSRLVYGILGGILGLLLMICIHGTMYLLSKKLRLAEEMTGRYGVPVYGELAHSRARRPGKGIDGLIEKWEFRRANTDRAAVLDGVCALIRSQELGDVLLTGTVPSERLQAFAGEMAGHLGEETPVSAEGSFMHNSRAITEAGKAGAVILVEEAHESQTDEMNRMAEVLGAGKARVIGAIVI